MRNAKLKYFGEYSLEEALSALRIPCGAELCRLVHQTLDPRGEPSVGVARVPGLRPVGERCCSAEEGSGHRLQGDALPVIRHQSMDLFIRFAYG